MTEFTVTLIAWILFSVILILMIIYVLVVIYNQSTAENESLKSENERLRQELSFEKRRVQKLLNKS